MGNIPWPPRGSPDEFAMYLLRLRNRSARLVRLHVLKAPDIILYNETQLVAQAAACLGALTATGGGVPASQILRRWADVEVAKEAGVDADDGEEETP